MNNASTDAAIFMATSIVLYSTGHWIGGTISLLLCAAGIRGGE